MVNEENEEELAIDEIMNKYGKEQKTKGVKSFILFTIINKNFFRFERDKYREFLEGRLKENLTYKTKVFFFFDGVQKEIDRLTLLDQKNDTQSKKFIFHEEFTSFLDDLVIEHDFDYELVDDENDTYKLLHSFLTFLLKDRLKISSSDTYFQSSKSKSSNFSKSLTEQGNSMDGMVS